MHRVLAFLLLLCLRSASAQTAALAPPDQTTPSLLSPQAAYDQANLPLDITRRDQGNWSDIELNALDIAVAQAKDACLARVSQTYTGSDLVDYARLCAFGKQWHNTYTAAHAYIDTDQDLVKPLLPDAYALEVQADLNLGNEQEALATCIAMLHAVPYSELTDEVTTATVRYMEFAFTFDAATLMAERQPFLLKLLQASQTAPALDQSSAASSIPVHVLFEHALDFAAIELYDKQPSMAGVLVADINRSLPANLSPDEAILIAAERRQYALIGTQFPDLPGAVSLANPTTLLPAQPQLGAAATVFLLFPPWCVQCIRQAAQLDPDLPGSVHIYALLADTPPQLPPPAPKPSTRMPSAAARHASPQSIAKLPAPLPSVSITLGREQQPSAVDQLRSKPTLVVAPSTLADFNAGDFPFLIATDHNGVIRLMVPAAPYNALKRDGPIDQIVSFIAARWPPPPSAFQPHIQISPPPPAPSHP